MYIVSVAQTNNHTVIACYLQRQGIVLQCDTRGIHTELFVHCKGSADRKRAAATGRPSREIATACDQVTPDRSRQLRAVQCEEKPSSYDYKVVSVCFRLGYFSLLHDVQFR